MSLCKEKKRPNISFLLDEHEDGKSRWRERLSKLEEDLNELVKLESQRREQIYFPVYKEKICAQKQNCVGVCSCPLSSCVCSKLHKNHPQQRCDDIPRFLRNINFNIAKGTEAINKIVNFASLTSATQASICAPERPAVEKNNENQFKSNIVTNEDVIAFKSWRKSVGSNNNVDGLFKELRDEKDKRQRAENQLKILKEDLKKCRSGVEEEYEEKMQQLNQKLKGALELAEATEIKLGRINRELESQLLTCNMKCEMLLKDLKDEQQKRKDAELEKEEMATVLEKQLVKYQDILQLRNQLDEQSEQNKNAMNLVIIEKDKNNRLEVKVEELQRQLIVKQNMTDQCTSKTKQLINICEKLKNQLLTCRQKYEAGQKENQDKRTQIQDLMDRSMELQSKIENLQRQLTENRTKQNIDRNKHKSEIKGLESDVQNMKDRLFQLIEINKKQESLISSQNESIERKQKQLWVAFKEISRLHQHIQDFPSHFNNESSLQGFEKTVAQLRKQIESEKQTLLIKDKIIEDQRETIEELKKNLNSCQQEVFNLQKVQTMSQRELAIQKTANEELTTKLKQMQVRKEELKQQLLELENELEDFQWHSHSSLKDEQLLDQLEKQVMERQKEWEIQAEKLQKERDDAMRESRSTKQTLQQKANDFQQELQSQRHVQGILENTIKEKERKLAEYEQKIVSLNEELKGRTNHFESITASLEAKLLKASEVWRDAVMHIKSQTFQV